MGCVENISFEKFPKQADENYEYPKLGNDDRGGIGSTGRV